MSNISIARNNIALNAILTASGAATGMPVANLQQEDIAFKWRSGLGTSAWVGVEFATVQSADTFCLFGTNLTAVGQYQIALYTAFGGSLVFNSGLISGAVDPNYKSLIFLSTVHTGWKYIIIDLVDTSLSYIEAGFLFISTRAQLTHNYDFGHQRTVVDPSIVKKTIGGQSKVVPRQKYIQHNFNFGLVTEAQRWSVFEDMDLANGSQLPVLMILDPSSSNLGRDSVFGLMEMAPVEVFPAFEGIAPFYRRAIKIEERL